MIEALRRVQERITAASPPDQVVTETAGVLEKLARRWGRMRSTSPGRSPGAAWTCPATARPWCPCWTPVPRGMTWFVR
jgi:hypothetical protein